MATLKLDLLVQQGATFVKAFNWYGGGKVCYEIESITPGCETTIEVTGHGLPVGADTPIYIDGVEGMKDLNTKGKEILATYVDANTFTVFVNTIGKQYTSGTGAIMYFAPKNLSGYTARMQIRESIDDATEIVALVSPTDIVIDTISAQITVTIAAAVTEDFVFDEAVYDLELVNGPLVTRLVEGKITLSNEVTR